MLTFEEKLDIIDNFPELERKEVSLGRVNYHFEESVMDKKNVVYHLHPNGNGFVYAEYVDGYETDDRGMVNIRDFSEEELKNIVRASIDSLSTLPEDEWDDLEEEFINVENQTLTLVYDFGLFNIYAGEMLDGTFPTYNEAIDYLEQEGFKRK
ncbi:hypothetical protein GLW08_09690 [Pontibacillus yanchengensis]|uniref:Uncharacterized protein n=2 Tax=Pontibacillus yanchengensis TaxID=462910 RepID=A0ACC7VFQ6_9BACI|nr:hypothetical protein [Pontibacillus yanchengensis]MYL33556.1 hypothetical protein [Pontibacillus yanchengensis]MYL53607.1 hypothetical protein [Pontibacillus yanchengensis]